MRRAGVVCCGVLSLWLALGEEDCLGQEEVKEIEAVVPKSVDNDSGMRFLVTKSYDGSPDITDTQIAMFDDLNERTKYIYPPKVNQDDLIDKSKDVHVTVESGYFADKDGNKTALPDEATKVYITFKLAGSDAGKYRLKNPGPHEFSGKINVKKIEVDIPDNKKKTAINRRVYPER